MLPVKYSDDLTVGGDVDNRVMPVVEGAVVLHEARTAHQRFYSEHQIEKARPDGEPHGATELDSSLHVTLSDKESTLDYGASQGGNSNQSPTEEAFDNHLLTQNMHGQTGVEHQKISAPTSKSVPGEPTQQIIPEQVVHQVKERLSQIDVKPGIQQMTLTLSPDNLGELKMNLNLQGFRRSFDCA